MAAEPDEPLLVLDHPMPDAARVAVNGALVLTVLLPQVLAFAVVLVVEAVGHRSEYGPVAVVGTMLSTPFLAFAAYLFLAGSARRRWGRCELFADRAVLKIAMTTPPSARTTVRLAEVVDREETPWGILLRVRGRRRVDGWFFPLLIPAYDHDELARAVAVLDAEEARREGWSGPG